MNDTSTEAVERHCAHFDGYKGDYISMKTASLLRELAAERDTLKNALVQAAIPLEGLTLAANLSGSNLGLSKLVWTEINESVAAIRNVIGGDS